MAGHFAEISTVQRLFSVDDLGTILLRLLHLRGFVHQQESQDHVRQILSVRLGGRRLSQSGQSLSSTKEDHERDEYSVEREFRGERRPGKVDPTKKRQPCQVLSFVVEIFFRGLHAREEHDSTCGSDREKNNIQN